MQGFAERKKDEHKLLETEKKKPHASNHLSLSSMSEGPMLIKETQSLEERARASFEHSVKIELEAMKKLKLLRKKLEKAKKRKKGKKRKKRKGKK